MNQGGAIGKDDLLTSEDEGKDSEKPSKKPGKMKGLKARCVTRTRQAGIQDDTVEIELASDSKYSRNELVES